MTGPSKLSGRTIVNRSAWPAILDLSEGLLPHVGGGAPAAGDRMGSPSVSDDRWNLFAKSAEVYGPLSVTGVSTLSNKLVFIDATVWSTELELNTSTGLDVKVAAAGQGTSTFTFTYTGDLRVTRNLDLRAVTSGTTFNTGALRLFGDAGSTPALKIEAIPVASSGSVPSAGKLTTIRDMILEGSDGTNQFSLCVQNAQPGNTSLQIFGRGRRLDGSSATENTQGMALFATENSIAVTGFWDGTYSAPTLFLAPSSTLTPDKYSGRTVVAGHFYISRYARSEGIQPLFSDAVAPAEADEVALFWDEDTSKLKARTSDGTYYTITTTAD